MSNTNAEGSPAPKSPSIKGLAALGHLDWKKDKKKILPIAGGAALALVVIVLIYWGGSDADASNNSQKESNQVQALASLAATLRPDMEVASVDAANQMVTYRDKSGALSTFKYDSQSRTLIPVPAQQPEAVENPTPGQEQPESVLPEWVPIYPSTSPDIVSSAVTQEGDKQYIATFKSGDKPTDIVQFYQGKLQESGFKIESASSGEPGGTIQAHDKEKKRFLILNVDLRETGTASRLVTVQKK